MEPNGGESNDGAPRLGMTDGGHAIPATADLTDPDVSPSHELQNTSVLFAGVTAAQMAEFSAACREVRFAPDEFLVREGATDSSFYVIVEGVAQVLKSTTTGDAQMRMAEVRSGDVLGELKIVDPQPGSASVVATTPVTAMAMDLDTFANASALAEIRAILLRNIGKILAVRLRARTTDEADALQRELAESQARAHAGRFIVLMFAMLAVYNLAVSSLGVMSPSVRPSLSLLSFILVIWTVIPSVLAFRRSPFSLESYGLTMRGAGRAALQSLLWTAPLLLIMLVFKMVWIRNVPSAMGKPLFDPTDMFDGRPFDLTFYLVAALAYSIHSPLQELVARSGFQGSLQNFIPTPPGTINWKAIIVSNLLFSASHAFIGFWFCVAAFVPGLFWGWMFGRQRSLVGVSVSHIAVGLWGNFIVGLGTIIGG